MANGINNIAGTTTPVTQQLTGVSARQLIQYIKDQIKNIRNQTANNTPSNIIDTYTRTSPRIATIDMIGGSQKLYNIDGIAVNDTEHSTVTSAGIKAYLPNATVDVRRTPLQTSDPETLQTFAQLAQDARDKKIDAAYLSIGFDNGIAYYKELLKNPNLTIADLRTPAVMAQVRQAILALPDTSPSKKIFLAVEATAQYVPVYLSAGNSPNTANLLTFATGSKITRVGSANAGTSSIYDIAVPTQLVWTKLQNGWDINGDNRVDLLFGNGPGQTTEGASLANGTKRSISGGTSLGVSMALAYQWLQGQIGIPTTPTTPTTTTPPIV